ncbi:hypothetical protein [Lacihabitans soyangensis]|nr:hypothetical protein [Lacihabitans soyangensis]
MYLHIYVKINELIMAKENKAKAFGLELSNLGKNLMETPSTTPMQKVTISKPTGRVEETRFTVHLPADLFDKVREIGFKEKKKIKAIMVEALEKYIKSY